MRGQAKVWTDKPDYAPGETALISGSGWWPNEVVDISIATTWSLTTYYLSVTTDNSGTFSNLGFPILEEHLGEEFLLMAFGTLSGLEAETFFTDGNVTFNSLGLPAGMEAQVSYRYIQATGPQTVITGTLSTPFTIAARNNTDVNFTYPTAIIAETNVIYGRTAVSLNTGSLSAGQFGYEHRFESPNAARTVTGTYAKCLEITQQPVLQSVTYGSNAVFSVDAYGATSFQWQVNTGTGWSNVSGATANILTVTAPTVAMSGRQYRVVVTGNCGTLTSNAATLTVSQRHLTVTADNLSKVFGENDPPLTYKITTGALAFADTFTGSLSRVTGENVGTYNIAQSTLALNANYNLSFVSGQLNITPKPVTVTAEAKSKTYGDVDPGLTFVSVPAVGSTLANGLTIGFTGSLIRNAGEDVGSYAILQGSVANANYAITYTGANLLIGQLSVAVNAEAKSKTYGDVDPGLTFVSVPAVGSSLANGLTIGFTGSLSRVAGEDVGSYAILQGSVANANYAITFVQGNFVISPALTTSSVVITSTVTPVPFQYSDMVRFTSIVAGGAPLLAGGPQAAASVTFMLGSQIMGTAPLLVDGANLKAELNAALVETVASQMAPGLKNVSAIINNVNANYQVSPNPAQATFTLAREDSDVSYLGSRLVASTSSTVPLDLRAMVTDKADSFRGSILNANVSFIISADGQPNILVGPIQVSTSNLVDAQNAIVSTTYNYSLGTSLSRNLTITTVVNGYYTGGETVMAVVYIPSGDHVTGGGFIVPTQSAGLHPSSPNTHANFGFNFRYQQNRNRFELQGNLNLVYRQDNSEFQFHSTEALSLGVNTHNRSAMTATFTVRGNLRRGGLIVRENVILLGTMTDRGTPGTRDDIGFTIWDGNTLIYSSHWDGNSTERINLSGGNLVVHSGSDRGDIPLAISQPGSQANAIAIPVEVANELRVFPNPFRDRLNFSFAPTTDTQVRLELFDLTGALVEVLFEGSVSKDQLIEVHYTPRLNNSTFLFYRLTMGSEVRTGKVMYQR